MNATQHPTNAGVVIMTRCLISAVLCSCCLLLSVGAHAQLVYDLRKLTDSSDLVAVAKVSAVNQTGSGMVEIPGGRSIPAHFRVAALHLQDVLKGLPAPTDVEVRYTILYSPGGWSGGVPQGYAISDTLVPNSTKLVFLKRVGDGYKLTNGSYLSLVCAPEASDSSSSADTFSRVLLRLTGALFSASLSEQDKAAAIRQLGVVDSDSVVPALRDYVAGDESRQNEFLRVEALVALLRHKDESVVRMAESELLSGSPASWKENLLFALTRAVPPPRSIPILAEALSLPSPQMRTSAAMAIYQTNSPEGIPPLLQAIDDPDPQVAFAVMQGLGNLTKDYEWRPKSTEADADWFRCLNHWREYRTNRRLPEATESQTQRRVQ